MNTPGGGVTELRGTVAGITAECDAARSDVERERAPAEQRVTDLRETYERQVDQLGRHPSPDKPDRALTLRRPQEP